MIDFTLVNDAGRTFKPKCRTGVLLLAARMGRRLSDRAESWLRRWTIPGLDATVCQCSNCGGVRYSDWEMVEKIKKQRSLK